MLHIRGEKKDWNTVDVWLLGYPGMESSVSLGVIYFSCILKSFKGDKPWKKIFKGKDIFAPWSSIFLVNESNL